MPSLVHDMKPETRDTTLEIGLRKLLSDNFSNEKEWFVYSNLRKFKPSMSVDIYGQKIGKLPEICEVYWKGEMIAEISIFDTPDKALVKIQDGMIELMTRNKEVALRKEGKL